MLSSRVACFDPPKMFKCCGTRCQEGEPVNVFWKLFVVVPFVVVSLQFYSWIVSLKGLERQRHCRALGITYATVGTVAFVFRSLPFAVIGLVLFMLGLRLMAHGLERVDKTIFIDQLDEDL